MAKDYRHRDPTAIERDLCDLANGAFTRLVLEGPRSGYRYRKESDNSFTVLDDIGAVVCTIDPSFKQRAQYLDLSTTVEIPNIPRMLRMLRYIPPLPFRTPSTGVLGQPIA